MCRLPWLHLEVDEERASPAFHSCLFQAERVGALSSKSNRNNVNFLSLAAHTFAFVDIFAAAGSTPLCSLTS